MGALKFYDWSAVVGNWEQRLNRDLNVVEDG